MYVSTLRGEAAENLHDEVQTCRLVCSSPSHHPMQEKTIPENEIYYKQL